MNIISLPFVDSTNKYVKDNYPLMDNFSFVFANYQTNGKGREDRVWESNENQNLLFSILIKDKNLLSKYKALSIGTATLIARFLELNGLKNVQVKWPNDVLIDGKKIAGILLEGNVNEYLVIGVGLNVNQTKFDGQYNLEPTSMKIESNKEFDIEELKTNLSEFLAKHYVQKKFVKNTFSFYSSHDYLKNKKVTINRINGVVKGINKDFELLIDNETISSGEVKIG